MIVPTPEEDAATGSGRLIADRYRLENKLGGGAMGTVWSGTDEFLRRPVAIKEVRLPTGMPEEEAAELRERALREARAIAVVTHPNVVTLYDVARENGEPFVVMELVPSQSLATIIGKHGVLHETQLALIADGVAAALEAAHRNGIIHRDVKPGNVLIGDTGQIKLSDFGISRNVSESTITRTGVMLGTPAFIAPEIASGEPITAAADLWGLGTTLFAASEGHPPYDTDNDPVATITSVVQGPVPAPLRTGPIAEIISGLMVKTPANRMSLGDVRRHVRPLLPETGARPFDMLLDPDAATIRVKRPATAPAPVRENSAPDSASEPAQLASQPGPLPFMLAGPPPRKRSSWTLLALSIGAVVVFTAALAGSFAATRTAAGAPLLPAPSSSHQPDLGLRLVTRTEDAQHSADNGDGRFQLPVPENWAVFQGERGELTNSKTVYFVSPDGRQQVAVERLGGFHDKGYALQDYVDAFPEIAAGTDGDFRLDMNESQLNPDPAGGEAPRRLAFSTTESVLIGKPGNTVHRTGKAELIPRNGDLWTFRVTVPQHEAAQAAALFNTLLPRFAPLS